MSSFSSEFETENNLKLRSKEIAFSQQLHNYSKNFEVNIKQLFHAYEHLKTAVAKRQCQFLQDKERIEEQYANLEDSVAMICENEMIETVSLIHRSSSLSDCSFLVGTSGTHSSRDRETPS